MRGDGPKAGPRSHYFLFSAFYFLVSISSSLGGGGDQRRAEGAAAGVERDLAQALGALLRRRVERRLAARELDQRVHRQHDEVVDHGGDDDERDDGVDEVAVEELAVIDREGELREVRLAADRR